jgi:hypothetical protein
MPLKTLKANIVQSIRAFRPDLLQETAQSLGQHFLYVNLASAQSKQDVLDMIAKSFTFPAHFGKNFDALYDCLTDSLHKSGQQLFVMRLIFGLIAKCLFAASIPLPWRGLPTAPSLKS